MVPFFSMGAHHRSKLSFSREWVWEPTVYHFSPSWNWELIFFLSNNYKPILSVGKGKNLRNAILANSHKYNCHDMNWNDMDIQKVLLLIKEHGTSLFCFKLYFPLRSATLRETFSRDREIKEPFWEAFVEASDFENTLCKEKICKLKKNLSKYRIKTLIPKENTFTMLYLQVA